MAKAIAAFTIVRNAWITASLSLRVMAVSNALLLGYVHLLFANSHPDYYSHAWPSFSRALSEADVTVYRWIAAVAAVFHVISGTAVAFLHLRLAHDSPTPRALLVSAWAWGIAGALGIVHYLHLTIVVNTPVHTNLSYVFFFGMTLFVVVDAVSAAARRVAHGQSGLDGLQRAAQAVAVWLVAIGLIFLATFFLKDAGWNPWQTLTQKVFVVAEVVWVVLIHAYGLLRVKRLQPQPGVRTERFPGVTVKMNVDPGRDGAG
jgi:hypothetical protein